MKLRGLIFLQHFLRKPVENILPEKYCSWIVNTDKCQTDASEGFVVEFISSSVIAA